jgi:HK97 family phage major capsid protein
MDTATMSLRDIREAMKEKRSKVQALREKNGGTLVGLNGTDADEARELMAELNDLGEKHDELLAQEKQDGDFETLQAYFEKPAADHPGHASGNGKTRPQPSKDAGTLIAEAGIAKEWKETGQSRQVTIPLESIFTGYRGLGEVPAQMPMGATLLDSTGYPIQPQFIPEPVSVLYQKANIGPLFAQGTTSLPTIRYVLETVTATGAAETAEGAVKPEAQISMASVDEPVRKIAVVLPITDEMLEDVPLMTAYINARLRLFVQNREDAQLLNGNGTAPNLKGILNRSGIDTSTSYSIGGANPDQALVEAVFHASMRVRDAFLDPDAFVMKPSTWEIARLAKDAQRRYLLGDAAGEAPVRLWGLPGVLNANMPNQTATNKDVLVGAFGTAAMLVRRSGIDMAISDSHSDFFYRNQLAIRAEERVALAVWRPAGFAAVTSAA